MRKKKKKKKNQVFKTLLFSFLASKDSVREKKISKEKIILVFRLFLYQ